MVTASSRATCSTPSFLKQNTLCVIPSPLTGATSKITVWLSIFVGEQGRGRALVGVSTTGRTGEDSRQFQKSLFLIYHSPSFLSKGLLAWGLLLRLCGLTIGPFSVFAFPVLKLHEGTIILGFLQGSWGQTLGSHACIANILQTGRSLFQAPSPHPLAWFYLAFFLLRLSVYHVPTSSLSSAVYRHKVCCPLTGNNGNELSRREYSQVRRMECHACSACKMCKHNIRQLGSC